MLMPSDPMIRHRSKFEDLHVTKSLVRCFLVTCSVLKADFSAGFHINPLNPDRTDFSAQHTDF